MMIECELLILSEGTFLNFWAESFHNNRDTTFSERKATLVDFRSFEQEVKRTRHVKGWLTWVKHEYPVVKRIVQKLGGQPFLEEKTRTWFVKYKENI